MAAEILGELEGLRRRYKEGGHVQRELGVQAAIRKVQAVVLAKGPPPRRAATPCEPAEAADERERDEWHR